MSWSAEQLARLARLSDECLSLPAAERRAWLSQARAQHADTAAALDAMAATTGAALQASPPSGHGMLISFLPTKGGRARLGEAGCIHRSCASPKARLSKSTAGTLNALIQT